MNTLTIIYIVVIFVAFYFLLIRPQQKRAKEQQALMASLRAGDRVVTVGGIFGTIERLDDDVVELRIADGVTVEAARSAVSRKVDTSGHTVEPEEDATEELPEKPRSEDVEEPPVRVDEPDDEAGESPEESDAPTAGKDQ